jgi:tetratricopeptide (TPR) repeat protein
MRLQRWTLLAAVGMMAWQALVECVPATAQSQGAIAAPPHVYVKEFKSADGSGAELNQFVRQYFKLSLRNVDGIEIAADSEAVPCGEDPSVGATSKVQIGSSPAQSAARSGSSPAQWAAQNADRSAPTSPVLSVGAFYSVRGTIDEHGDESEGKQGKSNISLAYELVRTKGCVSKVFFRGRKTFALSDTLQNLADATGDVSLELSDDVTARVTVRVAGIDVKGDPSGSYRAVDLLTRFSQQRIADAKDLRLWSDASKGEPKFVLRAKVTFRPGAKSTVFPYIQFFANDQPIASVDFGKPVPANADALIPAYLEAAGMAVKNLSDLSYAQFTGLADLSTRPPDVLVRNASELLCADAHASKGCVSDPRGALIILDQLFQKSGSIDRREPLVLEGRARFQSGEFRAAGQAYDEVLSTSPQLVGKERLKLLQSAGDSWYEAKDYTTAAERYRTYIGISDGGELAGSQDAAQIAIKLVHSLSQAGQPFDALTVVVENLQKLHGLQTPLATQQYAAMAKELPRVVDGVGLPDLVKAEVLVESSLKFDGPLLASGLDHIGQSYDGQGRYDEAAAVYRKAIALDPQAADAVFRLGLALDHAGRPNEAAAEYRKIIVFNSNDAIVHNNLGVALAETGDREGAIREYRRAVELQPSYSVAEFNLAWSLWSEGKLDEAEKVYRDLIVQLPTEFAASFNLWSLYRQKTDHDKADAVYQDVQQRAPSSDQYAVWMTAIMSEDREEFEQASMSYKNLAAQHPENPEFVREWSLMDVKEGIKRGDNKLVADSVSRLENEIKRNPSFELYYGLGWIYEVTPSVRNLDKSEQMYQLALRLRPDDQIASANLTGVKMLRGKFSEVIEEERKALERNPADVEAMENLGYSQYMTGDVSEASETFQAALKSAPSAPDLRLSYAEVLFARGEFGRVHEECQKAREYMQKPDLAEGTWTWMSDDKNETEESGHNYHVVYYFTLQQKSAAIELYDAMTYLTEGNISVAFQIYERIPKILQKNAADSDIARKAINDLYKMKKQTGRVAGELGLGFLYEMIEEKDRAAKHWSLYLVSGDDAMGIQEARRHLDRR